MANDLRKQDSRAASNPAARSPAAISGDRDRRALRALSAEWAGLAAQAVTDRTHARMQGKEALERNPGPDFDTGGRCDLRFRVRIVECTNGTAGLAQVAASFEDEDAARAFIRSKVATGGSFGADAGRHWGENAAGDQVCYWIETDQETASVKRAQRSR